jgi:hypothetical protein
MTRRHSKAAPQSSWFELPIVQTIFETGPEIDSDEPDYQKDGPTSRGALDAMKDPDYAYTASYIEAQRYLEDIRWNLNPEQIAEYEDIVMRHREADLLFIYTNKSDLQNESR